MYKLLSVAAILLLVNAACKKETKKDICFIRTGTDLKMINNTNKAYSYFAIGQNIQPFTDWLPECNYNIEASATTIKKLSEIPGYQNSDTIVVFWWDCINDQYKNMQSVNLATGQSSCTTVRPL